MLVYILSAICRLVGPAGQDFINDVHIFFYATKTKIFC